MFWGSSKLTSSNWANSISFASNMLGIKIDKIFLIFVEVNCLNMFFILL